MGKLLKKKRVQLILAIFTAFAISLTTSFGVNASIDNQIAATSLVENTSEVPAESDESALGAEVHFAKMVIYALKKALATRI